MFYKDYLNDEKLNKWLIKELLENENHIDFKNQISKDDYDQLLSDINEGHSSDDFVTHSIGKITDQYLRDGTH